MRRLVVALATIALAGSTCVGVVSAGLLSARTVAGLIPIRGLETAAAANVRSAMPSVEAYVQNVGDEDAEELAAGSDQGDDAVHVLTAHATAGRGFDTVVVLDVI